VSKEQLYHIGVKAIIRNPQNKILVIKRVDRDSWDLPGGRIQEDENVYDALRREVKEETGLVQLENITARGLFLTKIKIPLKNHSAGLLFYYHTCLIIKEQSVILSPEHNDFLWVEIEKAKTLHSDDSIFFSEQNIALLG